MIMYGDYTEEELVQQARDGDFDAFDELVNRHERRLYSLAMGILRQSEDAEDAVQTAFIKALDALDSFRGDASFKTWITRIATNTALKILRKRRGLPTVSLDEATTENEDGIIKHPEYIADWRADPALLAQQDDVKRAIEDALAQLDDKYRLVFLLRDVHEFSTRDTARTLELSEANVKVRLLRARLFLREKLTRIFGDRVNRLHPPDHQHGDHDFTTAASLLRLYQAEQGALP